MSGLFLHGVGATGQVLPEAALQNQRHLPLCLDLKEVVGKGDQGNLISLCLLPQPLSELAFLGHWTLTPDA